MTRNARIRARQIRRAWFGKLPYTLRGAFTSEAFLMQLPSGAVVGKEEPLSGGKPEFFLQRKMDGQKERISEEEAARLVGSKEELLRLIDQAYEHVSTLVEI